MTQHKDTLINLQSERAFSHRKLENCFKSLTKVFAQQNQSEMKSTEVQTSPVSLNRTHMQAPPTIDRPRAVLGSKYVMAKPTFVKLSER